MANQKLYDNYIYKKKLYVYIKTFKIILKKKEKEEKDFNITARVDILYKYFHQYSKGVRK